MSTAPALHARRHSAGLSLIELIIIILIVMVMVAFAYPSMLNFIQHNQVVMQANSFQADLLDARGEAAATRTYVSLCPLATAQTQTCASNSSSYDAGWLVYTTSAPNSNFDGNASNLLRVAPATVNVSIRASASGILSYNSRGELLAPAASNAANDSLSVTVCSKVSASDSIGSSRSGVPGIQLNVGFSGRVAASSLAVGAACS